MEINNKELVAGCIEEENENFTEEHREVLLLYTKKFIKENLVNIDRFCYLWNGTNGIRFKSVLPDDLVFKVLGLINEGRRICYTKSYKHFKGSVYYHVKNELLTYFNCRTKVDLTEEAPESIFTLNDAENYFEEGAYADGAEDMLRNLENDEIRERIFSLFDPKKEIDEVSVLREILKGEKREEIADSLNKSVDEVTNIRKRINRKIEKHFNKNLLEGII